MALKRDKYDIEVQNDDAIKRNRIFFDFMQQTFNFLDGWYLHEKGFLMETIIRNQSRKQSATEVEILNRKKDRNKNKEGTSKPPPEKSCFVNKTTRKSRETSNTYYSNFNADTPQWSEGSISEEEDIGMCEGRRKINFYNTNKEVKGKSSEEEEIKIPKCRIKSHAETVNEETKESSSE